MGELTAAIRRLRNDIVESERDKRIRENTEDALSENRDEVKKPRVEAVTDGRVEKPDNPEIERNATVSLIVSIIPSPTSETKPPCSPEKRS